MCKCANRLKVFMQHNGFVKSGGTWLHPNGYRYGEEELSKSHTKIMLYLIKEKTLGRLRT